MPLPGESMPAAHVAARDTAAATAGRNFTWSFRRSSMVPRLAHPGRRIEYGISIDRVAAINGALKGSEAAGRVGCPYRRPTIAE